MTNTKITNQENAEVAFRARPSLWHNCLRAAAAVGAGWLLGKCSLLFSTAPMAMILLCTAPRNVFGILAGAVLAQTDADMAPLRAGIYLLAVLARVGLALWKYNATICRSDNAEGGNRVWAALAGIRERGLLFEEDISFRMLNAGVWMFFLNFITVLRGGFRYYDLFGMIFCLGICPVGVFLLSFAENAPLAGQPNFSLRADRRRELSLFVLLLSLCYAARQVPFLSLLPGVNSTWNCTLAVPLILFFSIAVERKQGMLVGLFFALLLGLCDDPVYLPMYGMAVMIDALLADLSVGVSLTGALIAAGGWCTFVGSISEVLVRLPALAAGFCGAGIWVSSTAKKKKEPTADATEEPKTQEEPPGEQDKQAESTAMDSIADNKEIKKECASQSSEVDSSPAAGTAQENAAVFCGQNTALERDKKLEAMLAAQVRAGETKESLRHLADAFRAMANRFHSSSQELKHPNADEMRRLCDACFNHLCPTCAHRTVCWETCYRSSADTLNRLSQQLQTKGYADAACIPDDLRERCPSLSSLLDEINRRAAAHNRAVRQGEKTEVCAKDYEGIARIFSDLASDLETTPDERNDAIAATLHEMGCHPRAVVLSGEQEKHLLVRLPETDTPPPMRSLEERIAAAGGLLFPSLRVSAAEGHWLIAGTAAAKFRILSGYAVRAKTEPLPFSVFSESFGQNSPANNTATSPVSGDVIHLFCRGARQYALLCDGMGTGREAAHTAGLCGDYMEKMLCAGVRTENALRMVNAALRAGNGQEEREVSTTVDLAELDTVTGHAVLYKSGAAPTYLFRAGKIHALRAGTVPIGILQAIDVKTIRFPLQPGDRLLLASDGLTGGEDLPSYLRELASGDSDRELPAQELAHRLTEEAVAHGSHDDISVIVLDVLSSDYALLAG